MNYGYVRFILGRILLLETALLIPSLLISLIDKEDSRILLALALSMGVTLMLGILLSFRAPLQTTFYAREGFVIVALAWIALSLFGALPFVISGAIPSMIDAFFEMASGFTTTGASILTNVEAMPRSLLFWRSLTHLIGGMGVLVFVLAIMPRVGSAAVHIMKAEVPGPVFGKLLARVSNSARVLYVIYLLMTAVLVILLVAGGMPLFDSFLHAFGTAGTGGFGIKNTSIAFYDSAYIEMVLAVAMILFGVNFNLYYLILIRQVKTALKNEELRWYLGIITASVLVIAVSVASFYDSLGLLLRDVFFTVSSIITTTGYVTADFNRWPLIAQMVLLLLMFVGAMSGSTGGGLKVTRVALLIKTGIQEIRRTISPNRHTSLKFDGKSVDSQLQRSINVYFMVYALFFTFSLLFVSIHAPNFITAFSAVAATFNNIGPGLDMVGPTSNYAGLSDLSKIVLSFAMIAGRLEILPVLILFSPRTWRKI